MASPSTVVQGQRVGCEGGLGVSRAEGKGGTSVRNDTQAASERPRDGLAGVDCQTWPGRSVPLPGALQDG